LLFCLFLFFYYFIAFISFRAFVSVLHAFIQFYFFHYLIIATIWVIFVFMFVARWMCDSLFLFYVASCFLFCFFKLTTCVLKFFLLSHFVWAIRLVFFPYVGSFINVHTFLLIFHCLFLIVEVILSILNLTKASSICEFLLNFCFLYFFWASFVDFYFFHVCSSIIAFFFHFMFTIRWRCNSLFLFLIGCLLFILFFTSQWHAHQLKFVLLPCFIHAILTFFLFFLH
jgi:hypothetical protein